MTDNHVPSWLQDTILYQIYPQSFADANGDGIGDVAGIASRLEYLQWLGVGAIWINPCWVSPFGDAGYDVSDYLTVAPRYGTNDELIQLIESARSRGIRVLLDLVPGHTSVQHPWFLASQDDATDNRYIWSDRLGDPVDAWVPSPGTRAGFYRHNFYPLQPALNFGYARSDPAEPWRTPIDADGPRANRTALREVLAYWFERGASGFRVDMAASLVKDDPGHVETAKLWRELRHWLDGAHPGAVLMAEWGDPKMSVPAGFHADFFLHVGAAGDALRSLWDNHSGMTDQTWNTGSCFFDDGGLGSPEVFLREWRAASDAIGPAGYIALPSSNHDFPRLTCGPRTREQLGAAFAFLLTWPTIPVIYYGDEIGMRYLPGLPDKEGSRRLTTRNRGGSRTPMQWNRSVNAGFSTAPAEDLYLPIDPLPDRPTVAQQRDDEKSVLQTVRRLIALRRQHTALGVDSSVDVLHAGYPFVYLRGESHLVVVNPSRRSASTASPGLHREARALEVSGVTLGKDQIVADAHGYGVFAL